MRLDEGAGVRSTQRLALGDVGGAVVLLTWPAELMPPAHYLYDGERGPRLLAAARDGVWGVDTRPHLAFVQAKRWTKNVGIKAVQEANAAPAVYGCSNAMVVTNRYFTDAAKKLASANDVALWDRDHLVKALLAARDS